MKIAVIGATGKQGGLIVQEALKRGHQVTAIVRNRSKVSSNLVSVIEKDIFKITADDVRGFDAVVDAFRASEGHEEDHITSLQHLIQVFESLPEVRLLIVGGAGSLYVDKDKKLQLVNSEGFPDLYKPTALNMAKAFDLLKKSSANWTYLSPSAEFDFTGTRTGSYILGDDNLTVNAKGESYVSYADYAIAMVDEIEKNAHGRKRFTVAAERA